MPRCKNGSRRNKKTGKCVRKKSKSKKICTSTKLLDPKTNRCIKDNTKNRKKLKMKTIKLCPPGKLLNTKTNRCILNNTRNRKKLNIFIDIKKKEKVSKIKKSDVNIFTDKCKSYDNLVSIDLNKVEYIDDLIFKYKNKLLNKSRYLSEGSYGQVYEIYNRNHKIALKTYNNQNDEEIDIIKSLNRLKISCNTINARIIKINNNNIAIMDYMSGPLSKMRGKLKTQNIFKIIKDIAIHLNCLNKHNLSYTDLKADNILFKCDDKKYIKTVLGDLGSICNNGHKHTSTFPPWEYRFENGTVKCNEKSMVWGLGLILFELLSINVKYFHWSKIDIIDNEFIIKFINDKSGVLKNINLRSGNGEELIKKMLDINPTYRCSLITVINTI